MIQMIQVYTRTQKVMPANAKTQGKLIYPHTQPLEAESIREGLMMPGEERTRCMTESSQLQS